MDVCNDKLGIQINPDTIDRTHRIGRFNPDKKRPIVVKFAFFKHKEAVLRSSYKLKNTNISVGEDFPRNVQLARKKLLDFARTQEGTYKLRVDKLFVGDKHYLFNYETCQVYEATT